MPSHPRAASPTRTRILRAALRVFSQQGYHNTRMDDVARASRASKGALYLYFPSKEALLSALLRKASRILFRNLDQTLTRPFASRQKKFALTLYHGLETIDRHRRLARLLVKTVHLGPPFDDQLFAIHQAVAERIAREIQAAVDEGDLPGMNVMTVAHMWVGALYGVIYHWLHTREPRRLVEVFPVLCGTLLRSIGLEPDPEILQGVPHEPME